MIGARRFSAVSAVATVVVTAGCATNGLSDLPLPAPGGGTDGYELTVVFANALNLPEHAKVKLAGADVGQVAQIRAEGFSAVITLRVAAGTELPVGSTAELRSATPLGDVFIAITPPQPTAPGTALLSDGDTIGIDHTTAAATVESTLASAALLVNGGAVQNLTNIINGTGRAAGADGQAFGDLITKTNHLLGTLNARSDQIESSMAETERLATALGAKNEEVSRLFEAGAPATRTLAENSARATDMALLLGDIAGDLRKFPSIAGADNSGRSVVGDANTIAGAFNDVVLDPDTDLTSLNRLFAPFIKITSGTAIAGSAGIDRLVLGSIPDAGFGGDVGFHGPKRADWHKLVGSLKYVLFRLQERVVGQGP